MAISDKPIVEPDAPKPGIPLRRSTLIALGLGALVVALLGSLALSPSQAPPQPGTPGKGQSDVRQVGTAQALKDEEAQAARTAARAASAPAAPASAGQLPPIPQGVRRDDNTAALYDKRLRGAAATTRAVPTVGERDVEMEATARMAKAVVQDFDDAKSPEAGRDAVPALRTVAARAGEGAGGSEPPSASVNPQVEAIRKQIMQQVGAAAPKAEGAWIKEYEQDTSAARRKVIRGSHGPQGLVLRQGKMIPAVLGREINSDLPGRVTAHVASNVYDTDGRLLIPMGSALIGRYDSGVKVGQSRLLFAFERLILPNGYSFDLPAAGGTDLAGTSGMTGDVNNHFLKMFGTSFLIAILADHTKQPQGVVQIGATGPATAAGQVLNDVSKSILERNRVIPPTITIQQGTRINVEVVADMVFPESYRVN
ncbi:TrbI/VirB10 family protein [Caenimonas sedimenti]|uniref:TrbI/VirB10 family protein n=1 Tax=Caenimonas sedimenti TaxID=2596921 RepID=A0A562ZSU5_9BURK|nr:TrbI/VirB10 family protein [Caenimonas sedimenti]TWO71436.1 TrbI/VirB10 family protein [Caenimonas sedimenti]